ncbi:MAG: imidazole glycerol phosphate synthase subunit HisH [Candidatus Brocadiaceae bacterium]|nr:imidazole glycerol phosphate synthase subunit HisH [Candidatus Brocadiaceae bacterium]
MIAIVDYGMGNLRSVQKAVERVGFGATLIHSPEELERAEKLILPGVGAFADTMKGLEERGLVGPIIQYIKQGRPFLGICMGLQILFSEGTEDGLHAGLNVIPGRVVRFPQDGLKVPHMGWNQVSFLRDVPLARGIPQGSYVYFVHSYYVCPEDPGVVAATTDYGTTFTSFIWKDNLFATQFHPEKSQSVGLSILRNFAAL